LPEFEHPDDPDSRHKGHLDGGQTPPGDDDGDFLPDRGLGVFEVFFVAMKL